MRSNATLFKRRSVAVLLKWKKDAWCYQAIQHNIPFQHVSNAAIFPSSVWTLMY